MARMLLSCPVGRPLLRFLSRWLAAALILFVIAYAGVMVSRELGHRRASAPAPGQLVANGVVALYFHGHYRCDTCDRIERFTRDAIDENFAGEMGRRELAWRSVNTDILANAHFTEEFHLVTRTVIIAKTQDGFIREWKKLDRVWDLVGDEAAFKAYVAGEISAYLGEAR